VESEEERLVKKHLHGRWKKVVSVLACMVVFCTTYALILPAITMEKTPQCGKIEHMHSAEAGCYEENKNLICQQEESDNHHHESLCYGEPELTCGLEEHTHGPECMNDSSADSSADLETADIWESSLPEVIPEKWDKAVLEVAKSQLGYRESSKNYIEDEDGNKKGYTRYGEWYGDPYGDWCAMFVSFCLNYAGIPDEAVPREAACERWVEALQKEAYDLYRTQGSYTPKTGDLIFFDRDGDGRADHVGLVAERLASAQTEPVMLRTIEGNSDDSVQCVDYRMDDITIYGYGELPEEPRVEYRWSGDGLEVTASVCESGDLPENASLMVEPLLPEDEESTYAEKYAAVQAQLVAETPEKIARFDLFRVYLEANGREILPETKAAVEIRLLEDEYGEVPEVELLHYAADGTEKATPELDEVSGELTASFDAVLSGEYAVVGVQELSESQTRGAVLSAREASPIMCHKTIDAFRDDVNNTDTELDNSVTDKTDLYRLYLDAAVKGEENPIDLLIVVDESGSMTTSDMTNKKGNTISREAAIREVLNGTDNSNQYNAIDPATGKTYKESGLIYKFLEMNTQNQVAVVGFYGGSGFSNYKSDASDLHNGWAGGADTFGYVDVSTPAKNRPIGGHRTNYCAGLRMAQDLFAQVKNDGRKKVMLFLSDGVPTYYMTSNGSREGNGLPYATMFSDNPTTCANGTINYFDSQFYPGHQDVTIFSVGIFPGEDGNGEYSTSTKVLEHMATKNTVNKGQFVAASNTNDVQNAMWRFIKSSSMTNLQIEDTLSEYVDVYEGQPDFKLTVTDEDGVTTPLWENGSATEAGKDIVQSVSYNGKVVTATFKPDYHPLLDYTYKLSFNVKTNQTAYEEYARNGYSGVTGDDGTDYSSNETSSKKPGFHSNTRAIVSCLDGETQVTAEYPHPVVQAVTCKAVVQKTDINNQNKTLSDAEFTLYRKAVTGETGDTLEGLDGNYVKIKEKLTTDTDGQFVMENLIPGDYCLVETKAPEGYIRLTTPVPFTLSRTTEGTAQITGSALTINVGGETLSAMQVSNIPWGDKLPMTGGIGTDLYTIGGLLLIAVAGALLLYDREVRKRKGAGTR